MIPLLHDFARATVLVFGGGPVGARRARTFAAEARTVVVSPAFADADFGDASLVRAAPDPDDVSAWFDRAAPALVVAATDDTGLNDAIETAARDAGVPVNRVDRSDARGPGCVVVPAIAREGPVVVAVATGGHSPALSGYLRRRIEDDLDGADAMADLTADLRADLRDRGVPDDRRRAAMWAVVESERVWDAVRRDRSEARRVARDAIDRVLSTDG